MSIPSTGTIEADDLNIEFRLSGSNTFSLSSPEAKVLAGNKATNQQIAYSDFYGRTFGANVLFVCHNGSPYIGGYAWSAGFGTKYANPSSLPNNISRSLVVNKKINPTVVGSINPSTLTSRYTNFYQWSNTTGFGTRLNLSTASADPTATPVSVFGRSCLFAETGTIVIIGSAGTSPNAAAWAWSDSTGFGTKFANPASEPPDSYGMGQTWQDYQNGIQNGSIFFTAAGTNADRVSAWAFSSTGWGTKFTNPATLPTGSTFGVTNDAFTTHINTIDSGTASRYAVAYAWSDSTGWGTKYSAPASTLRSGVGYPIAHNFVIQGSISTYLAYGVTASPWVDVITWSGDSWGSKFANPATLPAGQPVTDGLSWNMYLDLAVGHESAPNVSVYPFSSTGFGTKYANPGTQPAGNTHSTLFTSF